LFHTPTGVYARQLKSKGGYRSVGGRSGRGTLRCDHTPVDPFLLRSLARPLRGPQGMTCSVECAPPPLLCNLISYWRLPSCLRHGTSLSTQPAMLAYLNTDFLSQSQPIGPTCSLQERALQEEVENVGKQPRKNDNCVARRAGSYTPRLRARPICKAASDERQAGFGGARSPPEQRADAFPTIALSPRGISALSTSHIETLRLPACLLTFLPACLLACLRSCLHTCAVLLLNPEMEKHNARRPNKR